MTNQSPPQIGLEIPYFNYVHAARMGNDDVFLFGKNNAGEVFVEVPTDCNPVSELFPDITGSNPGPTNVGDYQPGDDFPFFYGIINEGDGGTTSEIAIQPYLSTDAILDASDISFPLFYINGLWAGQPFGDSDTLLLPSNLAAGSYYLILQLDANNANTETNESNNVVVSTDPFNVVGNGMADLAIMDVSCPGQYPGPGVTVTWDITVKNNSTTASANPTEVYLWNTILFPLAKRFYGSATIPALAPGASTVVSISVPSSVYFPNPGQAGLGQDFIFTGLKYLSFDPNGNTQDYTEFDGFPDGFCKKYSTDLELELTPVTPTVLTNQPVTFVMTVKNNGPEDALNVEADFDYGFAALGFPIPDVSAVISKGEFWRQDFSGGGTQPYRFFWYIPLLAAGESATAEVTIDPAVFVATDYTINRTVSSGHNNDPNPSNNTDEIVIPYDNSGGDIDLELALDQPNANPNQWGNYEVTATLTNHEY